MDSLGVQQREAVPGAGGGTHGSQRERARRGASGGGGESASEQRQIQSSITRYLSNLRARNPVDTCSQNNQMYASNSVKKTTSFVPCQSTGTWLFHLTGIRCLCIWVGPRFEDFLDLREKIFFLMKNLGAIVLPHGLSLQKNLAHKFW